jgi:hypothetical protein
MKKILWFIPLCVLLFGIISCVNNSPDEMYTFTGRVIKAEYYEDAYSKVTYYFDNGEVVRDGANEPMSLIVLGNKYKITAYNSQRHFIKTIEYIMEVQ